MSNLPKLPNQSSLTACPPPSRGAGSKGGPRAPQINSKRRCVLPPSISNNNNTTTTSSTGVLTMMMMTSDTTAMVPFQKSIGGTLTTATTNDTSTVLPTPIHGQSQLNDESAADNENDAQQFTYEREKLLPLLAPTALQVYASPIVSCDALMSQARLLAPSPPGRPNVMKTAIAWYCFETLLRNSTNSQIYSTLRAVRDELHDALFFQKDPGVRVTPAVIYGQTSGPQMVSMHPFLRHLFYFEMYNRSSAAAALLGGKFDTMINTAQGRQAIVRKNILDNILRTKRQVFNGWHKYTTQKRQKRLLKQHISLMQGKDTNQLRLESALMRWRYNVEVNRCTALQERQTMMQFQLQNVKNQFQLQCFKTDKFLRTIEELRIELAVGRAERDEAIRETVLLKAKIEEQGDKKTQEMNEQLTIMGSALTRWKKFANRLVEDISRLGNHEVEDRPSLADLTMNLDPRAPSEAAQAEKGKKRKQAPKTQLAEMRPVEQLLIKWVNTILSKHPELLGNKSEVLNFTTDLEDGAVLIVLLHALMPETFPIGLLQENVVLTRLEKLCNAIQSLGLSYNISPQHIVEQRTDLIVLFLAGLFTATINNELVRKSKPVTDPVADGAELEEDKLDAFSVKFFLLQAEQDMTELVQKNQAIHADIDSWNALKNDVKTYTSLLLKQRMVGEPLFIVDVREFQKYTKLPKSRLKDLHWKYNAPPSSFKSPSDWLGWEQQLEETRKFLRAAYPEMRRVFQYYASAGTGVYAKQMSATEFWQFCGDARFVDKFMQKAHIERIFNLVNQEDTSGGGGSDDDDQKQDQDHGGDEDENPMNELVPSEFVESLVRIADGKYLEMMLHEKMKALMSDQILPHTCHNDSERFRKDVNATATQAVMKKYNRDLGRIYNYYAKLLQDAVRASGSKKGAAAATNPKAINLQEFIVLLSDADLMNSVLTDNQVRVLFQSVQMDSGDVTGESEMSYAEFLAVIPCIACYHFPSPFVPFEKKVEGTIYKMVDGLRSKMKGAGITLGDVKMPVGM